MSKGKKATEDQLWKLFGEVLQVSTSALEKLLDVYNETDRLIFAQTNKPPKSGCK